jgi:hypothetical protein
MTTVHNIRADEFSHHNDRHVYVGRRGHGHDGYFGNPVVRSRPCLVCGRRHMSGGSTFGCFETWARARLERDPVYRTRVAGLHGKQLFCFCAPKACHAEILVKLAAELQEAAR